MSKNPVLIPQPFAANGSKNNIQNTRQAGQDPEDATWSDGFPNVTMQPIESGGLPPKGMDFNGIFNALSATIVHLQKGNLFYFDKAYCDAFGGYQKGSILQADDGTKVFVSVADKNTNNPNQNPQSWEVIAGIGLNAATASKLLEECNIGGVSFDGSQDIDLPGVNIRGNQDTTGNAASASRLKNAVSINGIPFDGTKDINTTPAGAVMYFAMNTAPVGWLPANGAAVSRTTYANLFAAIGTLYGAGDGNKTFNLPDLRGEFLRSWDSGRGVDGGREFASFQDSQNLSHNHDGVTAESGWHTHTGWTSVNGEHSHGVPISTNGSGNNFESNGGNVERWGNTNVTGNHNHFFENDGSGNHTHSFSTNFNGGNESRPRNIALLACIKI